MQEPPRITWHDPGGTTAPPPHRAAPRRLRLRQGGALLLAAAVGFGFAQLLDVQERPPDEVARVSLRLEPDADAFLAVTGLRTPGTVRLSVPLPFVNTGPGPLTVISAGVVGSPLRAGPTDPLEPGETGTLVLGQNVICPVDGPPSGTAVGSELVVAAATEDGRRDLRLALGPEPLDAVTAQLESLCAWVPATDGLVVTTGDPRVGATEVVVPLRLANLSARDVRLIELIDAAGRGLQLSLREGGVSRPLPLLLPARTGQRPFLESNLTRVLDYELVLRLDGAGCAGLGQGGDRLPLSLGVDNGAGTRAGTIPAQAGSLSAAQLVGALCP